MKVSRCVVVAALVAGLTTAACVVVFAVVLVIITVICRRRYVPVVIRNTYVAKSIINTTPELRTHLFILQYFSMFTRHCFPHVRYSIMYIYNSPVSLLPRLQHVLIPYSTSSPILSQFLFCYNKSFRKISTNNITLCPVFSPNGSCPLDHLLDFRISLSKSLIK